MMNQVNIFLLSLGAVQGALLSWYLLRKQKTHKANTYFILILVVAGLQLTFKVISKVWLMQNFQQLYAISYYLPYLIGPLLFLYVKARASSVSSKRDLLHIIPFLAFVALDLFQLFPLGYAESFAYSRATLQLISLFVYGFLAWRVQQNRIELKSLQSFLFGLIGGELIIVITLAIMYVYYGRFPDVRLLFVALTLFIYWVSYKQIEQPDLFLVNEQAAEVKLEVQPHAKYNHSSLKPDEANRIAESLKEAMQNQKMYLRSDLSIDSLACQLNVSRHHISQVLNERFQQTYSAYMNNLRLAEAKSRLQNARNNRFTIAAIAMDSGFNSVSNFNELFKRRYGKTPSQCRADGFGKMTA